MKAFIASLAALALIIALCVASDLYVAGVCDKISALLNGNDLAQARSTWEQASFWVGLGCGKELCDGIDKAFSASPMDPGDLQNLVRELRKSSEISWDRIV